MKIKKWEVILAVALVVFVSFQFVVAETTGEQKDLSDKIIRMHVVANSDSPEDQKLKLDVRDAVNEYLERYIQECDVKEIAAEVIAEHYSGIKETVQTTLKENDCDYDVDITLSDEYYPTREYDTFTLPAGKYTSLQIKLGEAEGENWWCVVFPPLCTSVASAEDFTELSFTDEEVEFITSNSSGVVFKFKILEFVSKIMSEFEN